MGRRKERRLAAIGAAGRRVKLDLFAEPSGDVCGSSPQEEVGGDGDSKSHAKLPSSPSSSDYDCPPATVYYCVNFRPVPFYGGIKGSLKTTRIDPASLVRQQPGNPLMLLEQYSDDELDEGSSEGHNHAVAGDASVDIDEEGQIAAQKETEEGEINHGEEPVGQCLMDNGSASQDPLQKFEKEIITATGPDDLPKQTNQKEETTSPAVHGDQPVGDGSSCWKLVLHDESNQYYYWNIVTGETSWEVPNILAQANVMTSTKKVTEATERRTDAVIGTCKSSTHLSMEEGDVNTSKLNVDSMVNCQTSGNADHGTKTDGSNEVIKGECIEDVEGNRDASQSNGASLPGRRSVESNYGAESTDISLQLIKHCEDLLERLNSVKGLNCHLEGQNLKMKCTVEIETRLADVKALASHGLSLLPFWIHSEGEIKQLEAAVEGVIQCSNSASLVDLEATLESREGTADDTEIGASEKKACFTVVESHTEYPARKSNYEATTNEHVPAVWCSSNCPVNDVGGITEIMRTEKESELAPGPAIHSGEDVDMDVDMEVDDTSSVKSPSKGASGARYLASTDLPNVHHIHADLASAAPGEVFSVAPPGAEWIPPPPPDSEPIPPPPPDDEPFPPPPPDEPPESSYPPVSHLGSVQPFPHPEQYTISYPGSNIEYYGQTNLEASGSGPYTHSVGKQVAVSHLSHYYEGAANIYTVAPVIVNPVERTTYYGLQNGTLNPLQLISGVAESSGSLSEPAPGALDSGTAGSMDYLPEAGSNLLLETNLSSVRSGDTQVMVPSVFPEAHFSTGAPATSSGANGVSASSTSDATTSLPAAATFKSQSKVPRGRKRTVAVVSTLRSNKKVSSLVDKWKAAKEELHEEEEEAEDAYEILERKRQREIEEWRAQQIINGDARDNANFQPLGGDWRERVKRKRSQKMEGQRSSPDVAMDENQQSDLAQLSKGLPSGWQVYWDNASKLVYYGNVRTSETTWTRPTE
ncbi:hypothetical protein OROGR_003495 [Orobanche gracilis]